GHPVAPKVLVGREPVDQLGHRLSRDPVEAVPTLLALLHEPRLTQRAEVLGDAGPGHVELPGEFPGSELTVEKRVEDVTTSGVGKRAELLVQRVGLKTARQAGRPQPCRTSPLPSGSEKVACRPHGISFGPSTTTPTSCK